MASRALEKSRVGVALEGIMGPDGQPAKIIHSGVAVGFPGEDDLHAFFDFFINEHGRLAVRVTEKFGDEVTPKGVWEFAAIENRDAKGLKGFVDCAKSLGVEGSNLANLIAGFKPDA